MAKRTVLFSSLVSLALLIIIGSTVLYSGWANVSGKQATGAAEPEEKIAIAHTEIFGVLERPPVIFNHSKHVETLQEERQGCETCHPYDKEKNLIFFDFPKKVVGKDKDAVMNGYHTECIGCHTQRFREEKETGPITCMDCHIEGCKPGEISFPRVEFDFKLHADHEERLKEKEIKALEAANLKYPIVVKASKDQDPREKELVEKKLERNCALCHHVYGKAEGELVYEIVYGTDKAWSCLYCHEIGAPRGPTLATETRLTAERDLTIRKASHTRCLNCHLFIADQQGEEESGPLLCSKCHTGKYRTIAQLEKVPRPDVGQPETAFVNIEHAKLKGVFFDHSFHEKNNKTCRICHHETLNPCAECHTLVGKPEGQGINTADAFHNLFSEKSCVGCHRVKTSAKECAGCHILLVTQEPDKEICLLCHNGRREAPPAPAPLSVAGLDPEVVKEDVIIKQLEKQYEPAEMPHMDIIKELVEISNDSKLATYFHGNIQTMCEACHHRSYAAAEAEKDSPPLCGNCHSVSSDPLDLNKPRLLAAYHRQCIDCHQAMKLEKPKKCVDCHKEKKKKKKKTAPKKS